MNYGKKSQLFCKANNTFLIDMNIKSVADPFTPVFCEQLVFYEENGKSTRQLTRLFFDFICVQKFSLRSDQQ